MFNCLKYFREKNDKNCKDLAQSDPAHKDIMIQLIVNLIRDID